MKKILIFVLALWFAGAFVPAMAQDAAPPSPTSATDESAIEKEYAALVLSSYKMLTGFDFGRLRALYVQMPFYAPEKLNAHDVFDGYIERFLRGDRSVAEEATIFVKKHAALPEVHMLAAPLFDRLRMKRTAAYHEMMAGNLVLALTKTRDGKTPETAYIPLTYNEEHLVVRDYGKIVETREEVIGDRTYDVATVEMDQSGRLVDAWFDVTLIKESMTNSSGK
jgi:hypothetical protein